MFHAYKPGQGYWTRLMSAIGFGMIIAAGAFWAWSTIEGKVVPPMSSWTMNVQTAAATDLAQSFPVNQQIELAAANAQVGDLDDANQDVVGTAIVQSVTETGEGRADIVITDLLMSSATVNEQGIEKLIGAQGFRFNIEDRVGTPAFNIQFLQGGVALGVLVIGGLAVLIFAYVSKKSGEFLIATEGEMKKVNWSSRREVFGSTWVVIIISLVISAVLFTADLLFSQISTAIGILDGGS